MSCTSVGRTNIFPFTEKLQKALCPISQFLNDQHFGPAGKKGTVSCARSGSASCAKSETVAFAMTLITSPESASWPSIFFRQHGPFSNRYFFSGSCREKGGQRSFKNGIFFGQQFCLKLQDSVLDLPKLSRLVQGILCRKRCGKALASRSSRDLRKHKAPKIYRQSN